MKKYYFLLAGIVVLLLSSCALLEPEFDNHATLDNVIKEPPLAEGLLARGFVQIPGISYRYDERATDDAVTNDLNQEYLRMATGGWTSAYNPQHIWQSCNDGIMYVNLFLTIVNDVPFRPSNENMDKMFKRRMTGEAYAIRGILKYYLLRNHGGIGTNGELLGFPINNEFIEAENKEAFMKPRDRFVDCVNSAYADLDRALELLPYDYGALPAGAALPAGYDNITATANREDYNFVCGNTALERVSGRIAVAFKARLALLHASPAFNLTNDISLWEKAANFTAEILDKPSFHAGNGGFAGGLDLDPNGYRFYILSEVNKTDWSTSPIRMVKDQLWRANWASNSDKEQEHFPPSFNGRGRINPSQNFVDAFPMKNGYPITHPASGYDPQNPYTDRDNRLGEYVIYNGCSFKNNNVYTALDATGTHAGDNRLKTVANSTRTGYYLKKLLQADVNYGTSWSNQRHYNAYIRYTELFLMYAEAANEAWGPTGGPKSYNAQSIIGAIRNRAGIDEDDPYLKSLDQNGLRDLIQNERRIELSFESFRFWDIRRWKKVDLMRQPIRGVQWNGGVATYFEEEERDFQDFMIYGPIPLSEVTRFNYIQNQGW